MCSAGALPLSVEDMRNEHLDAVLKIGEAVFSNPWRRQDFVYALDRQDSLCQVALVEGRIIGYSVGFLAQEKFHLADFAVHPDCQGQGIGRRFLMRILSVLSQRRVNGVTLEVRTSNTAAIALYRGAGFRMSGTRKGYYSRPAEDALVMLKPLRGRLSD